LGSGDLARRVQVSRQTIHAIESGAFVPNTEVALSLARELEVTVDELFSLQPVTPQAPETLAAEMLSSTAPEKGQPVRICEVGSRWVGVPVTASPYYLPEADGVVQSVGRDDGQADLVVCDRGEPAQKRLVLAGCDPATGLVARMVEKISGVEIISAAASSKLALTWLTDDKVHIAGSHLEDVDSGEFNLPFLREHYPEEAFTVVTFARWEQGFVVAPGNPKGVAKVEDLARKKVRLVNREPGSGSRGLLDQLLKKAGLEPARVQGYQRIAYGHLAAAYCVASQEADVCLATRSAAQSFGLHFIPLHSERYDLVMKKESADLPAVKAFLDVLQRATLRRKLEVLAGYDTSQMGSVLA
jgi:molybdate-binding protein/DNA-binding XRE family transcriptional regulator